MKVAIILTGLLAVATCSVIPHSFNNTENIKLQNVINNSEMRPELRVTEDAQLLIPELIQKYGYPCERHTVITKDGYILEMHRIPYGAKGPSKNRPAVYLQHGVLSSSADWVIPGPGKGLAYMLVDDGYDVWMANVRGNRYSRKHVKYDPDKDGKKFWDFSWNEIGLEDVPSMIDYVRDYVKQEKIFYIGHSQGTTVFFVLCSEKPEFNNKIKAQFSLAPIGKMKHMTSPLMRTIAMADWAVGTFLNILGVYEFLPQSSFLASVGDILCGDDSIMQPLCTNSLFAVCGFNSKQMNATLLPTIMGHTPAGSSTKQLLHYAQEVNSGKFRKWDFGIFKNPSKYGNMNPPKYNMKKIKVPVYLHYSRNDWLSHEKDVRYLFDTLGNIQGKFLVPDKKFNHVDYVYGIEAPDILYRRILGLMKRHK